MSIKKRIFVVIFIALVIIIIIAFSVFYSKLEIQKAEEAIESIGTVTLHNEYAIILAENIYNNLSDEQQDKVKNYNTLTFARNTFDKMKYIYDGINTLNSNDTLFEYTATQLNTAYEALNEFEKMQITNYDELKKYICNEPSCKTITKDTYCSFHKCVYCDNVRVRIIMGYHSYCYEHKCKYSNCSSPKTYGDYCFYHFYF